MVVVAVGGIATAVMGATIALVQTDIKKVLAYSTVSQLGYMFLACGVGAFGVGVFHLFTHAFFKALLFLGSGSVIHALGGEQDMRKMGGLWRRIPWTFGTFVVGTLAIAGIPPLAGFFSKDAILGSALAEGHNLLFVVGLLTAGLTAFYMARLLFLTFFGTFRGGPEAEHHLHESPWVMLAPLVILAIGSGGARLLPPPHVPAPGVAPPASSRPASSAATRCSSWAARSPCSGTSCGRDERQPRPHRAHRAPAGGGGGGGGDAARSGAPPEAGRARLHHGGLCALDLHAARLRASPGDAVRGLAGVDSRLWHLVPPGR